jgi:protein SCO1/2
MTTDRSPAPPASDGRRRGFRGIGAAIAVVVIALVGALAVYRFAAMDGSATVQDRVAIGGPFELVDQDGNTVTDADFRGRYMLIYFGYTYCPDICPTSLLRNIEALDSLGSKKDLIQPILISVDPERDTPALLKDYAELFDPRLIALTGSPEQVAEAARAYRVYYAKAEEPGADAGSDYLMDHSGFTYLMGPDGAFVAFFRHDTTPDAMAARLRAELG